MTTVEAPATHLRENPYELAQRQLQRVADIFKIDQNLIHELSTPRPLYLWRGQ